MKKLNIVITGGPGAGKSTLAAMVFAKLKIDGFEYDLITDETRSLRKEFGNCRSPFERFYLWRQQEREELRSGAKDGFISDFPLFHFYISAMQYATTKRDALAVRELFRMCLEIKDRYQLIVIAENPLEIPYKRDYGRRSNKVSARETHNQIRSFLEHFWPEKLLFIKGSIDERVNQIIEKVNKLKNKKE